MSNSVASSSSAASSSASPASAAPSSASAAASPTSASPVSASASSAPADASRHAPQPPIGTRFLVFSASLRAASLNTRLAQLAAAAIERQGGQVDLASMLDFNCLSYDQDLEEKDGFPEGAAEFKRRLEDSDALVIVSPEYNASMPGLLKNAIDWVSRYRPQPFNERQTLLMSASPSMVGGNRGLWSLRVPLEHLGARVYPDMFSLATAHQMLTPEGAFANPSLEERFDRNIAAFMSLAEAAKNYPCIQKAWVEFLGERPDPATERVQ